MTNPSPLPNEHPGQPFKLPWTYAFTPDGPPHMFQPPLWLQGARGKWTVRAGRTATVLFGAVAAGLMLLSGSGSALTNTGTTLGFSALAVSIAGCIGAGCATGRLRDLANGYPYRQIGTYVMAKLEANRNRKLLPEWEFLRHQLGPLDKESPSYFWSEQLPDRVFLRQQPRHPKGSSGGRGGQFRSNPGGGIPDRDDIG